MIFDLSFRQCCLIMNAPIDWSRAFIDITAFDEAAKQSCRFRLVMVRHGQIGIVPLAQDPEALEISCLSFQGLRRVFTTGALIATGGMLAFLAPSFAVDIQLDRQSMAVVPRNVRRIEAHHRARLDDKVFQDLVQCCAEMNIGIRVRRAVVKDEFLSAGRDRRESRRRAQLGPFLQSGRFALGQIRLLRKAGLRKVDGLFKIEWGFSRHDFLRLTRVLQDQFRSQY